MPQAIIVTRSSSPSANGNSGKCTVRVAGLISAFKRVTDHRRLLEDLLLHEMAVVALADQRARGGGFADRALPPRCSSASKIVTEREVTTAQSPSSR